MISCMQLPKWIVNPFSQRSSSMAAAPGVRQVTVNNPLVIRSPKIGFLNLAGPSAEGILREDRAALASLFLASEESNATPPSCDVLLIYANLQSDGAIAGTPVKLRELIHQSRASIAIVAVEHEVKNYIASAKGAKFAPVNLVMTLRRRGPAFAAFFSRLFAKMFEGKTMPMAWVELAPQGEADQQENCPESVCSMEVTHIVFTK